MGGIQAAEARPDRGCRHAPFASDRNIKPCFQKYPMSAAYDAVQAMRAGKAQYRFVLVNEHNGGSVG